MYEFFKEINSTKQIYLIYFNVEYIYKNTPIFYEILGEGETLIVFLHGWGASGQLMMPLYKKLSSFASSEDSMAYLFIDFPPFGASGEPISPWNLDDYVKLTEEIIEYVGNYEKINIIGHSFGGRVAIKLCAELDSLKDETHLKIDKLVLLSSAGIKPRFSLKKKINIWRYKFYKKINSPKRFSFGSKDYKILPPIMKKTFVHIVNEDLTECCEKIKTKTLIIFGEKDKETPLYMGKILNKKIKNSLLIPIKKGDHFAYIHHLNLIFPIIHSFLSIDHSKSL